MTARLQTARKSAGELTAGELAIERRGRPHILTYEEVLEAWEVEVLLAQGQQAAWLDPDRGRRRPHRPSLDQLDRRQR